MHIELSKPRWCRHIVYNFTNSPISYHSKISISHKRGWVSLSKIDHDICDGLPQMWMKGLAFTFERDVSIYPESLNLLYFTISISPQLPDVFFNIHFTFPLYWSLFKRLSLIGCLFNEISREKYAFIASAHVSERHHYHYLLYLDVVCVNQL